MTKSDWPYHEDYRPRPTEHGLTTAPFVAQGVRNALRDAFGDKADELPEDFLPLLDRLR